VPPVALISPSVPFPAGYFPLKETMQDVLRALDDGSSTHPSAEEIEAGWTELFADLPYKHCGWESILPRAPAYACFSDMEILPWCAQMASENWSGGPVEGCPGFE
jgi:hypothetical protein